MTSAPGAAFSVVDLHLAFGSVRALDGLSFEVAAGSITALLGPNGAGKTSTVEICEGFRRADSGRVRVLGLDPFRDAAALRPRTGVMLQAGGALAAARTREMLRTVAACSARPLDPDWLLDLLGLTPVRRTPVRRLSGGQVQRLGLAMALVGRPELLFLDEPTAGLDPQARHLVWDVLRAVRADGATVVLTTHLLDEAELLADHVVIVDHGRLVAQGAPAELTGGDGAALRFSATPGLDLRRLVDALPEGYSAQEAGAGRYLVRGRVDPGVLATVASFCAQSGVLAADLRATSLEDVYLDLTGRAVRA